MGRNNKQITGFNASFHKSNGILIMYQNKNYQYYGLSVISKKVYKKLHQSFIYAPSRLMEHSDKSKAEEYVFIALTFGLITGSATSFATKAATLYL